MSMTEYSPGKTQRFAEHLKSQIFFGVYVPGMPIPPIESLCRESGYSYGAVQRAIALLRKQGLLVRSGRRIVVAAGGRFGGARRRIAVVLPRPERVDWVRNARQSTGIFNAALFGIQEAALQYNCWLTLLHIDRDDAVISAFSELRERMDGLIVFNEFEALDRSCIGALPVVGVLMSSELSGVSLVDIDPQSAERLAIAHFEAAGVRRVRVISDGRQTYLTRADAFRIGWYRRFGVMPQIELRQDRLSRPDFDFQPGEGIFITSDTVAHLCGESFALRYPGRSLFREFSVVSVDGKRLNVDDYEVFPTVAIDWREAGIAALEECLALIDRPGRPHRTIRFPGKLVID